MGFKGSQRRNEDGPPVHMHVWTFLFKRLCLWLWLWRARAPAGKWKESIFMWTCVAVLVCVCVRVAIVRLPAIHACLHKSVLCLHAPHTVFFPPSCHPPSVVLTTAGNRLKLWASAGAGREEAGELMTPHYCSRWEVRHISPQRRPKKIGERKQPPVVGCGLAGGRANSHGTVQPGTSLKEHKPLDGSDHLITISPFLFSKQNRLQMAFSLSFHFFCLFVFFLILLFTATFQHIKCQIFTCTYLLRTSGYNFQSPQWDEKRHIKQSLLQRRCLAVQMSRS